MKEKAATTRLSGAAARFIDARLAVGRVAFPLADLVKETGLSITAARNQLLRLGNRVVRPAQKHQFFLIVGPEHRSLGAPPVTWWLDDYFKWLGHPYYLARLRGLEGVSLPNSLEINAARSKVGTTTG
jgi:hypothetical protein